MYLRKHGMPRIPTLCRLFERPAHVLSKGARVHAGEYSHIHSFCRGIAFYPQQFGHDRMDVLKRGLKVAVNQRRFFAVMSEETRLTLGPISLVEIHAGVRHECTTEHKGNVLVPLRYLL